MGLSSISISERSPWDGGCYQMVRQHTCLHFRLLCQLCSRCLHCRPLMMRESLSKKCCLHGFQISCIRMQSEFSHLIDSTCGPTLGILLFQTGEFLHRRGRIFATCLSCHSCHFSACLWEDAIQIVGFPLLN